MWSIGVIMYILLSGLPPFNGNTDVEIMEKVKIGKYNFESPGWKKKSEESKDLIRKFLQKDTAKRITAAEALEHPWIKI